MFARPLLARLARFSGGCIAGLALLAFGAIGSSPASASAAEPAIEPAVEPAAGSAKLVVSPIEYSGDIPRHVQADVDAAMLEALASLSIESITARRELGCRTLACTLREARDAGVDHVIVVKVEADDRDFNIVVEARATTDGHVEFRNEELCELCGHHELLAIVTAQVRALAGLVQRGSGPPMLLVRGTPSNATVLLDGERLGVAPLELQVEPGPHLVELRASGYRGQSHRFRATKGIEEIIAFQLSMARAHHRGPQIAGWVGFGLGIAGLGIGGVLLGIDGHAHGPTCAADQRDVAGNCPNVYTTRTAGIVAASTGGAALVTGISLLVYAAPKKGRRNADKRGEQPIVEISPRPGGLMLRF